MKQRIEYIDAIKGLAIFLMVMGHAIAWNYDDYNAVCNFHPEQTINVKMGGRFGNLSILSICHYFLWYQVFRCIKRINGVISYHLQRKKSYVYFCHIFVQFGLCIWCVVL